MDRRKRMLLFGQPKYLLRDDFTDTVSAGIVNGMAATPGPGTRYAADAESKLSIGSGVITYAGGKASPSQTDPNYGLDAIVRQAGRTLICQSTTSNRTRPGFRATHGATSGAVFSVATGNTITFADSVNNVVVASLVPGESYLYAVVLRATGYLGFVKGTGFTYWTLLYPDAVGTGSPLYPENPNYDGTPTMDYFRVPYPLIHIHSIASNSFNRSDGVLGTTDGAGVAEGGGVGVAWAAVGTWGVATNKAMCSALAGGIGIATLPCSTINVVVEAALTRAAGNVGIVLRYQDAQNYVYAYHDGTKAYLNKVTTAGGDQNLINAAATYGAGKRLVVSANSTKFRLYYGEVWIGSEQTISDAALQTTAAHGIFTSDTGNSIDNFAVWAKGNEGQYEALFGKYTNP